MDLFSWTALLKLLAASFRSSGRHNSHRHFPVISSTEKPNSEARAEFDREIIPLRSTSPIPAVVSSNAARRLSWS
jgi:hypothetical protein